MDAENALKSEVFRPVVITLVPGFVAISPYLFVLLHFHPTVLETLKGNDSFSIAIAALIAATISAGYIVENIGSRIEHGLWLTFENPGDDDKWYEYLKADRPSDRAADSYMRDIVLRMKFENSFVVALAFVWIGITWLYFLNAISVGQTYWSSTAVIVFTIAYLIYESRTSGCLLRDLRKRL